MLAGKTLKEYFWPIKYYILASILIVISQYAVALPLQGRYPYLLNITQGLWVLMVALSVLTLVKNHNFDIKNVAVVGIFYCFIIHGLKISIRYFFYDKTFWYLLDRFLYGSGLVMVAALIPGLVFLYAKKKGLKL